MSSARQHAVFSRYPALATAFFVRRHAVFHTGGAQHLGIAKLNQHRAFGVDGVATGDFDGAQLVGSAVVGALESGHMECKREMKSGRRGRKSYAKDAKGIQKNKTDNKQKFSSKRRKKYLLELSIFCFFFASFT